MAGAERRASRFKVGQRVRITYADKYRGQSGVIVDTYLAPRGPGGEWEYTIKLDNGSKVTYYDGEFEAM